MYDDDKHETAAFASCVCLGIIFLFGVCKKLVQMSENITRILLVNRSLENRD